MTNFPTKPTLSDSHFWRQKPSSWVTVTGTTSSSQQIKATDGMLTGLFVSSVGTSPTIVLYNTVGTTTTKLVQSFVPTANQHILFPETYFDTGLYMTCTNTVNATVFYK